MVRGNGRRESQGVIWGLSKVIIGYRAAGLREGGRDVSDEPAIVTDVRLFHCVEQSELIFTLCVEKHQGDARLYHEDFRLTLEEALILKQSIDQAELDKWVKL